MRDATHAKSMEQWVEYMKTHKDWKKLHTEFINAQFQMSDDFVERMKRQPSGKERLRELYGIRNRIDYPSFF